MRLPDEYDDHNSMTPTVVTAIVAVAMFVGIILAVVLLMNRQTKTTNTPQTASAARETTSAASGSYPDTDTLVQGDTLTPDDLDFWDLYPEESETVPESAAEPEKPEESAEQAESDPSTDGKHTAVTTRDGEEEWVLISPYLPKHEYDFTKLVCQSDIMKYYEDGKQVSYTGVDVSKYQDYIDFVKVKKAGVDYVMIRVGSRGYGSGQVVLDEYFSENLKRASDAGLLIGLYFSSQAISEDEAREEANILLENIGDYRIDYPIAFDMEFVENDTARIEALSRSEKTSIAKAFLETIEAAGYKTAIYGDKEWLIKEIDMSKLTAYDVWLAQEADIPDYPYKFTMWQYSKTGTIDGISGYANLNISFIDYTEK